MNFDESEAAAQLTALAETTPDALVTIDTDSRIQFVNPAIEDVLGYRPADLVGESLTEIMSADLGRRHLDAFERYLSTGERRLDWDHVELPGRHADGHDVPLSIAFSEFTLEGERYFTGILRDISDRRRWATQLERLNEFARAVLDVESVDVACELAIDAAEDVLDLPLVTVARYDPDEGRLAPQVHTSAVAERLERPPLFDRDRGHPWEAFANGEVLRFGDRDDEPALDDEGPPTAAIVVPIGEFGVLVAGTTASATVSETDRRLAEILAGTLESIVARLDREASLRRRTSEVETRNEQLRRIQRVNDEIRAITQALIDATSREEVKQVVCDRLASSDPYRFVWFGERDLATDEVVPVAWAGVEDGYLDAIDVTTGDEATAEGPTGRVIRSREVQIQNDLQSDPPFEPWRQAAIQRDYRASASVPVTYRNTLYGVVNLYANEPGVFSELEAAVLAELGEMIGYGLNALERYDALVAEDSVELEFRVRDDSHALLTFLREREASFRLESIGEREGATQRIFAAFEGVAYERIESFFEELGGVGLTPIRERDEEVIVELTLRGDSIVEALLERGAVPTAIRGSPGAGRITIRLSQSASVREFLELLESRYEEVELVARRESPDPVQSAGEFERNYVDRLTDRQREVIRTAYFAGFFEQPRKNSARDVAEMLDVSQPTVSRHIRASEQVLFSMLFGDE